MFRAVVGVGVLIAAALVACGEDPPEVNLDATVEAQVAARLGAQATSQAIIDASIQATVESGLSPSPTLTLTSPQTNTPVPADTPTSVPTATWTVTATHVPTVTNTPTPVPTNTATPVPTNTPTPVPTNTATPVPTNTPTPVIPPTPTPDPITEVNFAGVVTNTNAPSQVQVVFALQDQNGRSIVLPADEIERSLKVFERGPDTDGWEEIGYAETSFFVHSAENIELEVVFALDFTNSMSQAMLPDGRSGIEAMLGAFDSALAVLPAAYRVGVVEFHDRNDKPRVLSTLTTDRQAVRQSVERFSRSEFDPGSSRVWDSVVAASDLFSSPSENPRAVRVVVFLSNGRDTSSENPRESAAQYARERSVRLYGMGVGEVFQEAQLREAVESTGGGYYSASDLSLMQEQLQTLVSDLRGQYQLTYITLRRTGEYETRIVMELRNLEGDTVVGPFDVARFFGPDNRGEIVFDPPSFDAESGVSTVFVRSLHVPRNIDRIRFKLDTPNLPSVDLVAKKDGGLLEGWTLSGPDADGYYDASSQTPLEFGNVGLLFALTFSSESIPDVPVEFDNTIYTGEKSLRYPKILAIAPLPPLTGRIAFSSTRGLSQNIYVMNADGSNVTQLTHIGSTRFPAWSPDGQRIAFSSRRSGSFDIYVMNADGSSVTQLTNQPGREWFSEWSPDGQRIMFSSYQGENSNIYVMNADGSNVTQLTNRPGMAWMPAWSPDGRRIAFVSSWDNDFHVGNNIYVMNADGSNVAQLTHMGINWEPEWSPDGRRIAFASNRGGGGGENWDIYVMNADGSNVTQLTNQPREDWGPAWTAE